MYALMTTPRTPAVNSVKKTLEPILENGINNRGIVNDNSNKKLLGEKQAEPQNVCQSVKRTFSETSNNVSPVKNKKSKKGKQSDERYLWDYYYYYCCSTIFSCFLDAKQLAEYDESGDSDDEGYSKQDRRVYDRFVI